MHRHSRPPWRWIAGLAIATLAINLAACGDRPSSDGTAEAQPTAVASDGASQDAIGPGALVGTPSTLSSSAATATALIAARLPQLELLIGQEGTDPGDLMLPVDVDVDAEGNLFVADITGVQKLAPDGTFLMRVGAEELKTTQGGLALGADGRLYVTGFGPLLWVFDSTDGSLIEQVGEEGTSPGTLQEPVDVAVDANGSVFVADAGNDRVEVFGANGRHVMTVGGPGQGRGQFTSPRAVALDDEGRIYVGVGDDCLIQRFDSDGTYLDTFGNAHADETAWRVGGIAVGPGGDVVVTQALSGRIQYFQSPAMNIAWEDGTVGQDPDAFNSPLGVTVVGHRMYIADQSNHRIKVYELRP